jgi:hypothetical protein
MTKRQSDKVERESLHRWQYSSFLRLDKYIDIRGKKNNPYGYLERDESQRLQKEVFAYANNELSENVKIMGAGGSSCDFWFAREASQHELQRVSQLALQDIVGGNKDCMVIFDNSQILWGEK